MDEPNDRRASRGMAVVRPIAFAVLRFRIVSYRVGSTILINSRDRGPAKWFTGSLHDGNPEPPMSAMGHKQTSRHVRLMSALHPRASSLSSSSCSRRRSGRGGGDRSVYCRSILTFYKTVGHGLELFPLNAINTGQKFSQLLVGRSSPRFIVRDFALSLDDKSRGDKHPFFVVIFDRPLPALDERGHRGIEF